MVNVFWFRRDLRLEDNAGLYHALHAGLPVQCIFIFDKNIIAELKEDDPRISFIYEQLKSLQEQLKAKSSSIKVLYGNPQQAFKTVLKDYKVHGVYTNHDFEPYAKIRDDQVARLLRKSDIQLHTFKDHVIFEKSEVVKSDGLPYTVFTPYKRKWLEVLNSNGEGSKSKYFRSFPSIKFNNYNKTKHRMPSLKKIGFVPTKISFPSKTVSQNIIKSYDKNRDYPALNGTSKLGIHFRFGTISIREKARKAILLNETYLSELIWRDFYAQIMYHFPHVVGSAFRAKYDKIPWRDNKKEFKAWCEGKTGYPLVDAGMRELNATGHMHNRVRMVTASFLTKHLLMDWRKGEAYFAEKLLDFDLASNNGGWQWASGSGTDAAPYFRIFNPSSQLKKFDKDLIYVKQWVPEYGTEAYPEPIVDHKEARERCLATYKAALNDAL